ncbi:hypothetical protein I3760_07G055800 [Carya illinoinensis]|nr:hypothetical protein I3760_07G055800 [Carya illinoinensis]
MDGSENEGGDELQKQNRVKGSNLKGKSCKGYLYYHSALKSEARNPRCIGISRTLQESGDQYLDIGGQTDIEASKDGRSLTDFSYACVGYSVYLDRIGQGLATDKQEAKTELPICVGLEVVLVDRRVSEDEPASAPAHIHNREDVSRELPQPRRHKAPISVGDDFLSRFTRNANLVASGVARNIRRVGNSIKETVDDIVYPYRKPPK